VTLSEEVIQLRLSEGLQSDLEDEFDISARFPPGFFLEAPRPAAVLIPLIRDHHSWLILYTKRTNSLPEHSGQVAFPGGRVDLEDISPEATALREAQEEIGLDPADVRVLGNLKGLLTVTNYLVTPVIGVIRWPFTVRLASAEVSRIFTIPLEWLADPNNHEIRQRPLPHPHPPVPVLYYCPYDGETLWGVSAHITINLLKVLRLDKKE